MGHVVVKYKVTIDQPEEGSPDYDGIAVQIDSFDEVQAVEVKPLAFGMMFLTTGIDPTVAIQIAMEAFSSAHSREQEVQADEVGARIAARAEDSDSDLVRHFLHPSQSVLRPLPLARLTGWPRV